VRRRTVDAQLARRRGPSERILRRVNHAGKREKRGFGRQYNQIPAPDHAVRRAANKHGACREMKPTYCHALSILSTAFPFHP